MRPTKKNYTTPIPIMRSYIIRKQNFFIMILLFCILLSGCKSKIKFEKSQDEFNTTYKNENIEVQIANNVENSEEVFKSIEQDLNIINNFEPIEKLSIRVDNKFLKGNDKSGVECNGKFVKTPQFKQLLIANAYDLYDNWKAVGIYGNLFADEMNVNFVSTNASSKTDGENNKQKIDFQSYYQNHDFSLFGAHFFPDFSSEEEIKNLSYASTSLVKYLLDNGQKEKLLKEEISIEDIRPWAEQNHIDLTYLEALYNHINEIRVGKFTPWEKLHLDTRRDINGFSIQIVMPGEEYDTATELENTIKFFDDNIEKHRQLMKKKAPNFYKEFEKPLTQVPKIFYEFNAKESYNTFDEFDNRICIVNLRAHLHEYCHYMMKASFETHGIQINKPVWVSEGVDPYLDYFYHLYDLKNEDKYIEQNIFDKEHFEQTKENFPFRYKRLKAYGDVLRANFTKEELTNLRSIYKDEEKYKKLLHIEFAAAIGHPEAYQMPGYRDSTLRTMNLGRNSYPGISEPNKQNYFANVSFVAYLIETYGYEKMLYFSVQDFTKITFEEYFEKSYEELETDWKQYIVDNIKGGELLVYGEEGAKKKESLS